MITTALLAFLLADAVPPPVSNAQRFSVPPENLARVFFQVLSDHGDWLVSDGAGLVWRPLRGEVGEHFVPFATGGNWLRGPEGWQFESRYSWGGIVFRYGTWLQDFDQRWVWMPGPRQAHRGVLADPPDRNYRVENDQRFVPPFVRSIQHPVGVQFAYPFGLQLGRQFPNGTEVRYPPGNIGAANDHTVIVPEDSIRAPILRIQTLRVQ